MTKMRQLVISLLLLLVAAPTYAQTYTEDVSIPNGAKGPAVLCKRNSAGATLTDADGDGSFIGCTATGAVLTAVGTGATDLGKAEDAAHTSGDTGVMTLSRVASTASGSSSTAGDYATTNVDTSGRLYVQAQGPVDHGNAVVGAPVITGFVTANSNPGGFSSGQVIRPLADLIGRLIVQPGCLPENSWYAVSSSDITDTTSTSLKSATASTRYYISWISISNLHASVNTRVDVLDGSTKVFQCAAAANGGGCTIALPVPIRGTANTAINIQAGTTGAAIRAAIGGCSSLQ